MSDLSPEAIKKALCDLTVVELNAYGVEIALAQLYSSGEVVTVMVEREANGYLVHDAGNAAMILDSLGTTTNARVHDNLKKGVETYGCQFVRSRVFKLCAHPAEIPIAAAVVGCASRYVADFAHQTDGAPLFDFRQQLVETLYEAVGSPRVRENDEVVARSGSRYQVSATILDERGSRPIAYVEAVSGHQAVARKFRALYELQRTPMISDTRRIAIFDDSRPGVTSGDISLLREVSEPLPFRDRASVMSAWSTVQ